MITSAPADTVPDLEIALSELVRLFNRPAVAHRLMTEAGVAIEVGTSWALARIGSLGPCRLSELAPSLGVDASTITHRVQALERSGYVERLADPADGRASVIRLSADGSAALERIRAARRALIERLVADWSDDERGRFTADLERVHAALIAEIREP